MAAFTELLCPSPFSLRRWQTNAICRMHFYSRLAQERKSNPWCQGQCGSLLSHHQQTKSWLRPRVAIVPSPSKGEGSCTVCCSLSSHRRAMGKPAYWLCQLLSSPAGWNTGFVCVKQQLYQSPDVSTGVSSTSITTVTPSRNATQHKKGKVASEPLCFSVAPLCTHSPSEISPDHSSTLTCWAGPCQRTKEIAPSVSSILTWLYTCFLVI